MGPRPVGTTTGIEMQKGVSLVKGVSAVSLALVLLAAMAIGCGRQGSEVPSSEQKKVVVTDLMDRQVEIKSPPGRVIVLQYGGALGEIITALGVEKMVVGVDDKTKSQVRWPLWVVSVPSVGDAGNPSIEKIVSLKPELVIAWSLKPELLAKLEQAGIPAVFGYGMGGKKLLPSITSMGEVFQRQERANQLLGYIQKQYDDVAQRTKGLAAEQRPKVYLEGSTQWQTFGRDREESWLVDRAGGVNLIKEQTAGHPVINSEWILQANPDVIVKMVQSSELAGFDVTSTAGMEAVHDEICSRAGLAGTRACKEHRVYVVGDFVRTTRSAGGIWYLAKWLHPDLFKDVDPEAAHRSMLKEFFGQELRGKWVYPER